MVISHRPILQEDCRMNDQKHVFREKPIYFTISQYERQAMLIHLGIRRPHVDLSRDQLVKGLLVVEAVLDECLVHIFAGKTDLGKLRKRLEVRSTNSFVA